MSGALESLSTRLHDARTSLPRHAIIKMIGTVRQHAKGGVKYMEVSFLDNHELDALEAQIRECFGRVVYSTKTHEKCADACFKRHGFVKVTQIVLSALTTGGLLTAVLGDPKVSYLAMIASTLISTFLLVLNAYMKDVDFGDQAEKHKKTASELWDVRESYLSVLSDLHDGCVAADAARKRRDALQARLVSIYASAPRTSKKAYSEASVGLKALEELTFSSDEEIDAFLPMVLRRAQEKSNSAPENDA